MKISNTAINADTTKEAVVFEFPAKLLEFPQFDSLDEFVAQCESAERALEVINEMTSKVATATGKNVIRSMASGSEDEIIRAGITASRNFTWKVEKQLSAKDKAARYDALMAEVASGKLSPEQIAARVAELAGA